MSKNYILVGSSSELSKEFSKLSMNRNLYTISTKEDSLKNHLVVKDYVNDVGEIISFINKIENPIVIFFNGFIAENRPTKTPTFKEIKKTIKFNYFVPLFLTNEINVKLNPKKFVYISSFAAVKPRNKNFIYGLSKQLLEKSIISSEIKNCLFIRFGKINTKFSLGHKNSIFDLEVKSAAKALSKVVDKRLGIVYPNISTKILSIIFYIVPIQIINKMKL